MFLGRRRATIKRVYVLGAGPAGLLAAQAAGVKGYPVTVFSKPSANGQVAKSKLYGCQYLHTFIPGIGIMRDGWRPVKYQLDGPVDGYRQKVYGDAWSGTVSPDEYGPEQDHRAWDLRAAYESLWAIWREYTVAMNISSDNVSHLFGDPHAVVITSIPARVLCKFPDGHRFASTDIWAMGSAPGNVLPYRAPDDTVRCNGWRDTGWYRAATVFGHSTLEWPGGKKPPIAGVAAVSKPLSTDCDCWQSSRVLRVGRYGTWTKGVLVHTAYGETLEWLP